MASTTRYIVARAVISICGALALIVMGYSFFSASPPLVWHESYVEPKTVRAGDTINVMREFTGLRTEAVTIKRKMVTGDCASVAGCLSYEMETGSSLIEKGRVRVVKPHVIPRRAQPGHYRLEYELHWNTLMGSHFVRHPVLEIDVVP